MINFSIRHSEQSEESSVARRAAICLGWILPPNKALGSE